MVKSLLENHGNYFLENSAALDSVNNLANVIIDEDQFADYVGTLLGEDATPDMVALMNRHRQSLMDEATTFGSPQATAFAIASFPLLVDVYSDDLLVDGVFTKPSAVPTMTLTRLRIVASKTDLDGNVVKVNLPNATVDMRNDKKELTIANAKRENVFAKLGLNAEDYQLSSKGLKVISVFTVVDGDVNTKVEHKIPSSIVDARGSVRAQDFDVVVDGNKVTIGVTGDINVGTGSITVNGSIVAADEANQGDITIVETKTAIRLIAQGGTKGFTRVRPESQSIDIIADAAESYEIEEFEEILQDWSSIYKKSVVSDAASVVKTQIAVNKNFEIADALEYAEAGMIANGAFVTKSLTNGDLAPAKLKDVFENIIPSILKVAKTISTNSGLKVNVIYAGQDTAVLLESLQDFVTSFSSNGNAMGVSSRISDIKKFKILSSAAINEGKIYLGRKGASEKDSSLIDLVYKSMYMIKETTNGKAKTFIRSRTRIEVAREETLGCIVVDDIANII